MTTIAFSHVTVSWSSESICYGHNAIVTCINKNYNMLRGYPFTIRIETVNYKISQNKRTLCTLVLFCVIMNLKEGALDDYS